MQAQHHLRQAGGRGVFGEKLAPKTYRPTIDRHPLPGGWDAFASMCGVTGAGESSSLEARWAFFLKGPGPFHPVFCGPQQRIQLCLNFYTFGEG